MGWDRDFYTYSIKFVLVVFHVFFPLRQSIFALYLLILTEDRQK